MTQINHSPGTKITAAPDLPTGGSGIIGWLSQVATYLAARLPVSLGIKTAAASLSIAPASDASFVVTGPATDAQIRASALPVTAGQITTTTATIASGAAITGNIDLGLMRLGRIVMPAAWDAANLTLQTSHDGADWTSTGLYDVYGIEYTIPAAAGQSMLVSLQDMLSVRYLRIRSGTIATPVNQAAARTLVLVLVP